jgi:hypothetical protein
MTNKNSQFSVEEIHTYAKHMICPPSLKNKDRVSYSTLGLNDFAAYPFSEVNQQSSVNSDPNLLMNKIITAIEKSLDLEKETILLLSDGKDSLSLALALSKMGVKCKTLTLLRKDDYELRSFVSEKAIELGHTPYFVDVEQIFASFNKKTFLNACSAMQNPVLDQGFIFFVFGIQHFLSENNISASACQFIDGLGNDEHLGYLPSKSQLSAFKLSKFNFWKLIPKSLGWCKWYLRSPAEAQGDLSALSCFYTFDKALDINNYFSGIPRSTEREFIDFRSFSRGKFHDHQCMIGKTKAAINSLGSNIFYPWTDEELSQFCFNLPSTEKYSFPELKNKICLRKLLSKELSWDQDKRGIDLFFDIKMDDLLIHIGDFVDKEVYEVILNRGFVANSVRNRAMLELLNLCGYLHVNGFDKRDIHELLRG